MKGKNKKRFLGFTATILTILLSCTMGLGDVGNVVAATRLYGLQQVVESIDAEDPFVILELVPDSAYESFGAYVIGEEPSVDSKLLLDCTNQGARRDKVVALYGDMMVGKDLNGDGTAYPLYYEYNSLYQEQIQKPENMAGWKVLHFEPTVDENGELVYHAENRTGYFVEATDGDYTQEVVTDTEDTTDSDNTTDSGNSDQTNSNGDVATVAEEGDGEDNGTDDGSGDVEGGDSAEDGTTEEVEYVYTYTPGEGTHNWVDDNSDGALDYEIPFENLYYKVTVTSNDWFSKNVLEYGVATGEDDYIEVVTITPSELEANINNGYIAEYSKGKLQSWNVVDLLYISNSTFMSLTDSDKAKISTYSATNDISAQTGYNIYEYVLNTNIPVIIDSSLMVAGVTSLDTNMLRLAYLLWDYETTTTPDTYGTSINVSDWADGQWPAALTTALTTNVAKKTFGAYGSVQGSIYINANSGTNMVNKGLATIFTSVAFANVTSEATYTVSEATLAGVSDVINEIEAENFYNELGNVEFTTEYNTIKSEIEISQSSVIKYILNYAYRRATVYKDTITVLDIEPTKYSTLTEEKIRNWLKSADSERIKQINIVQTTTYEFVGTLSDLTAEYDLIYIGSCVGPSGKTGAMNQYDSGKTRYNDGNLDGLIYTHTGDTYKAPEKFKGLLNDEYTTSGGNRVLKDGNLTTRFSGNDITEEKMNELMSYVDSGYPVVISNKFYTSSKTINGDFIDNSSYLYQFMSRYTSIEPKANVMSDNLDDSALLATYLNMPKLYLSLVSSPIEYAVNYNSNGYIDNVQYLEEVSGKYTLEYIFELADNAEAKIDTVAYEARIFIDTNADGRYDSSEELDGLTIREYETGTEVQYNRLETGVRYTLARELPSGYVGMIPWKLEITQVSTTNSSQGMNEGVVAVHTSATGYTAVPSKDTTTIRILQIRSANGGLDLRDNATFKNLFQNVEQKMNYNIIIGPDEAHDGSGSVTAAGYVSDYNKFISDNRLTDGTEAAYTAFYDYYFQNYDMVMIGFIDMFDDISSEGATKALKMFIDSGRSVLFSHDTTSFVNTNKTIYNKSGHTDYWGYYLNQYIRSTVGMDRYGVTEQSLEFLKTMNGTDWTITSSGSGNVNQYKTAIDTANKDFAYTPKSAQGMITSEVHGYSNGNLVMQNLNTTQYEDVMYTDNTSRVTSISQVNKGQITTYPYDINIDDSAVANTSITTVNGTNYQTMDLETMTVKTTHSQYYQLDLNLDKTGDSESDIVVWYCLADGMYDAVPNDVRNNYYIYSAGNIMYTGMGHSGNSVSLDEAKLFVNTMIASFNAGKKDPTIAIVKDADNKGVIKQYSYRTYDTEFGMIDQEDEVIHFYVNDTNIISGTKIIGVKYYIPVTQAEYITGTSIADKKHLYTTTTEGNNTIYLEEIDPKYIVSSQSTVDSNVIGSLTLNHELFDEAFAGGTTGSIKIYMGAQTTLDYDSTRADEQTAVVFTNITIKARDLFNLD